MTSNPSGIHPTEFNVLVKVEEVEDTTAGGIIMSDETVARRQAFATRAVIIETSILAFSYERWPEGARKPREGDKVIITKAAGVAVEGLDGEEYKLVKDKDIGAILEPSFVEKVDAVLMAAYETGTKIYSVSTDTEKALDDLDADISKANAEAS